MQNSTLKHPEDAQRRSFISPQITLYVNLSPSPPPANASVTDETLALALTYIFMNRSKQRGSRTGLGWDLLKLGRTDHDWQPWRLHGEALLPVRLTWEQRGRDRLRYWSQRTATGSLTRIRSPLFIATFFDNEMGRHMYSQNTEYVFNEISL